MLFLFALDPDAFTDCEREQARWHPERETLELAAAGAARVLGVDHGTDLHPGCCVSWESISSTHCFFGAAV